MGAAAKPTCIYCGRDINKVADGEHIVPLAIGGTVTIRDVCKRNLVCNKCVAVRRAARLVG
jgi:hypothetical protein